MQNGLDSSVTYPQALHLQPHGQIASVYMPDVSLEWLSPCTVVPFKYPAQRLYCRCGQGSLSDARRAMNTAAGSAGLVTAASDELTRHKDAYVLSTHLAPESLPFELGTLSFLSSLQLVRSLLCFSATMHFCLTTSLKHSLWIIM